jgi:hypothetical protein
LALLVAAIGASQLPDLAGILCGAGAASLAIAFAVIGFAVLHFITRGMAARAVVLPGTYLFTIVLGWPLLLIAMIGVAETLLGIRARMARRNMPPTSRV